MGLFWHRHAWSTREPSLLSHTLSGIIRSDRLFTIPSVIAIVATGIAAAIVGRLPILGTGWILWTIVLFAISGAIFAIRVAPLQRELLAMTNAASGRASFDHAGYARLAARWEAWGAVALIAPVVGLALMVLKPS
jgi:uncharacterized membrane protein